MRQWNAAEALRRPPGDLFCWLIEDRAGSVVGSIATHGPDRRAGTFGYGISVAPTERRRRFAVDAIRLVLRYSFQELGYQKAHVHVYTFNVASAALHERLGFQQEERLRQMVFTHGRHHDVLVYGLTRDEFATLHADDFPVMRT